LNPLEELTTIARSSAVVASPTDLPSVRLGGDLGGGLPGAGCLDVLVNKRVPDGSRDGSTGLRFWNTT